MTYSKKLERTDDEWRRFLTPERYKVLRERGTEPPFSGEHLDEKRRGLYRCAGCGNDLFVSEAKFESGSGWPSFWTPASEESLELLPDDSHGMHRTEVRCGRCGSHLGHLFDDGPEPTGLRFCINSVALDFKEVDESSGSS